MTVKHSQNAYMTDSERWQAVLGRDPGADGHFYYSVATTRVYCRPSCGSKPALRKNVQFHDTALMAERAGFRACKRCRPNQAETRHCRTIRAACELIRDAEESPALKSLAKNSGLSSFHFQRVFKSQVGLTPKEFADAVRAERIRRALPHSETVTRAIYEAGFNSNSRFYGKAAKNLGMAPRKFQKGGKDMNIQYGFGRASLGFVLVAATTTGICAVLLGDEEKGLLNDLRGRFRNANLSLGGAGFERTIKEAVKLVEEPRLPLTLPLDIRGTVFQQKVWNALKQIPVGQTSNYREIAQQIGLPKAVRAVAGACAANPIAVAVPCHRVLRSDGDISGYRWGIQRKRALLDREKDSK